MNLVVRASGWRGWPDDLQDQLTPVELAIRNGSGQPVRIRPDLFDIVLADGSRHPALAPGDLRRILSTSRARFGPTFYTGYYGMYPWPGFYAPWGSFYPYVWTYSWYGLRGAGPPAAPSGYGRGADLRPSPEGTLESGGTASVMLFFDVPADRQKSFTFEAKLEDAAGQALGTVRVPFAR